MFGADIRRIVSFLVLVAILAVTGFLFYRVMANFLIPLFLAAILVVIFNPLHGRVVRVCRGKRHIAAGLTTLTVLLIVLVPSTWLITLATVEAATFVARFDVAAVNRQLAEFREYIGLNIPMVEDVREFQATRERLKEVGGNAQEDAHRAVSNLGERVDRMRQKLVAPGVQASPEVREELEVLRSAVGRLEQTEPGSVDFEEALGEVQQQFEQFRLSLLGGPYRSWLKELANPTEEQLEQWATEAARISQEWLVSITGVTTVFISRLLIGIGVMVLGLFFFLADGPAMLDAVKELVPLDPLYTEELLDKFGRISRAVVLATFVSAIIQGLLAGVGFWAAGVDGVFLMIVVTMIVAIIPVIGPMTVWLPVCLWLLFYEERMLAAVMLALYGAVILSQSDYLIRTVVLHGHSKLHPLLALLSVLGGLQAMGPIGLLVGPMIVVFLTTLLNILHRELTSMQADGGQQPGGQETAGP